MLPLTAKLSLVLCLLPSVFSANSTSVVNVGYASYQGALNPTTNVTNFLGIRYATPPLGDLRWRAPQPPQHESTLQIANTEPNECFQANDGNSPTNPLKDLLNSRAVSQSEDCLFLNVHVPGSLPSKTSLPVVVWIHGGGYLAGAASSFDGGNLVTESNHGVVAVIIQYRLGVFGFLPGSEVKANGQLNAGLLDQEFALKWVQSHIRKFGGDPTRVTIWGESAGAGSVLQQVVARDGRTHPPLFRAAMTSSTFLPSQYNFNDRIPELLFSEIVTAANCTSTQNKLSCLRKTDAGILQTANVAINQGGFFGTFIFVPVIDGEFIVRRPTESLKVGRVNGQALFTMTNTNEGLPFVDTNSAATVNASEYAFLLFPKFDEAVAAKAGAFYTNTGTPAEQLVLIHGEAIFICPTYYMLNAFKGRSFKGHFAIPPASHGDDVVYYFPGTNTPPFNNADFIHAFSQSFLSFAISLDPNAKVDKSNITPHWNKFIVSDTEMLFNRTASGEPDVRAIQADPAMLERCNFWQSVGALSGQ